MAVIAGFSDIGVLEEMVNVGTLFAFVLVSIGVIVLRRTRPDLERSYKVPFMPVVPILSVLACLWLMINLTAITWVRFLVWMAIGVIVYFAYGRRHSLVGRREGHGLALTQEEIKATWQAEEDSGWVAEIKRQPGERRSLRTEPKADPDRGTGQAGDPPSADLPDDRTP